MFKVAKTRDDFEGTQVEVESPPPTRRITGDEVE
jgi:hypothetical protein